MIINFLNRHNLFIGWSFYILFSTSWALTASAKSRENIPYARFYPGRPVTPKMPAFPTKLFYKNDPANLDLPSIARHASTTKQTNGGGPGQPEMQAFQSVNANNMVDLFSGDFSYNIPLMDVGGYPVNISYRGGISMDQEASWVGLGWNINPGTITRNMRGLPDDFNGNDSIKKVAGIKENKTVGVTGGGDGDVEVAGFPINVNFGGSLGIFYNNYKGWGLENGLNASINAGGGSKGGLTGGLGLQANNNSQDGLSLTPSLSLSFAQKEEDERSGLTSSFSASLPYNSRTGLKGLQLSTGVRQYATDSKNQQFSTGGSVSGTISFASPTYTPTITLPMTTHQYSFTAKVGLEEIVFHPSFYISGYGSSQYIAPADTLLALPAYGYLHFQDGVGHDNGLLDMNREKELPYRDKPTMPHIAVPFYTYDAFSITGEGTGGMFRAYRGDIGYVHDHFIRTRDGSDRLSIDVGVPSLVHAGADLNLTRSFTQSGAWLDQNVMQKVISFKKDSALFEAAYFRNPGEKAINQRSFYEGIGGDDVVAVKLFQPGSGSSVIQATNYLTRYRNKTAVSDQLLAPQTAIRTERDKRTQVISYLNAQEADAAGLSKYIENYHLNQFSLASCDANQGDPGPGQHGVLGAYFKNKELKGVPAHIAHNDLIDFVWGKSGAIFSDDPSFSHDNFSSRYLTRLLAPTTGRYTIGTYTDDGVRLWINDSLMINHWNDHSLSWDSCHVNLVAGELYDIRLEYYNHGAWAAVALEWLPPGTTPAYDPVDHSPFHESIPPDRLFLPAQDTFPGVNMTREKRINSFRKANHISEIDVLNNDGRKYVYGIPVYNLRQKEATFAVNGQARGNVNTGLVGYDAGKDNTVAGNQQGQDHYFNSEEIPAYAHSFLLTGILSPDYVDRTGNGISDDDMGDAVKFNYSKVSGIANPYRWRAPYVDSNNVSWATYNEGLKTDRRDDKGNYVYGEKELWYLHTIESKTMIATFVVENRSDLLAMDESGHKYSDGSAKRLKEIDLYSKADFLKNGTNAVPIKTVHFEYAYDLCTGINKPLNSDGKLTLKKIWFTYNGNNKGQQNPYIFNYNTLNPAYNIKSYDRWGNYKDASQNPGSIASNIINNAEYPYSLQDSAVAAQNAAAWTLDSISLPSGGAIKVSYESDDYAYVQNKRAENLFKLAGFGKDSIPGHVGQNLYTAGSDNLYVFVNVPVSVTTKADLYQKYLAGNSKLYFKVFVRMPSDLNGSGWEYVNGYANLDAGNSYGIAGPGVVWIKMAGISLGGDAAGPYSPVAKTAIQFLRLNLPSKAYPGSQPGDNLDVATLVRMIFSLANNISTAFSSFDKTARDQNWCSSVDLNRSYVRLDNPLYKKYGGGQRVKRITIYDKWDKMTGQRAAMYGQEYTYTTQQDINGVPTTISSGVASYEPGIGGEENPFHQPIEYVEQLSALGPVTLGYSEEPLGESVFPSAGVGYSKIRVRTINYRNRKSANGYEETSFYTAYDFPTLTDRSLLDNDTKKRYKPALSNFLRIDARNYLTMSQGFKVELNDMHGKMRSQAYYPETDPQHYTSYTENFYRVDNLSADAKRLSNSVLAMHPDGTIDTEAFIGKDAELMVDMREQLSVTNGYNLSPNTDMFAVPFIPPLFILPSMINLAQREQDQFRSVATLKVIQRYGILDSVIHIDKGSKVSTKDLLYDSETGDVLLTRTQNEFNDPVYNFSYPSHWAYDGMGMAYKNIDLLLNNVYLKSSKLLGAPMAPELLFTGGDEVLVAGRQQTGGIGSCSPAFASFPDYTRIWAIDSSVISGGAKAIYFVDRYGVPYNDSAVSLKVIRSGRRNMNSMVGTVTSLQNPLIWNNSSQHYDLVLNSASGIVNAASSAFGQFWKVENIRAQRTDTQIVCTSRSCNDTIPAVRQDFPFRACYDITKFQSYSDDGAYIFASETPANGVHFTDDADGFWENSGNDVVTGRLNQCGIWVCDSCQSVNNGTPTCSPLNRWVGFSTSIYVSNADTLFIGMGGDNKVKVIIDGKDSIVIDQVNPTDELPFRRWYIFPRYFTAGYHSLSVQGYNIGGPGAIGAEVYQLPRALLTTADSATIWSRTLFSTRNVGIGQTSYTAGYSCPFSYNLDSAGGVFRCIQPRTCTTCDTLRSYNCHSLVSDTAMNPYIAGVLGNWRGYRNYTYFGPRAETDPAAATNIRRNGTFASFAPFWNFGAGLVPQYDTSRWVWNSEMTLFNPKGMEIENKDPLGRYNAIQYGYNLTLPVAVTQNGHYRESMFEGFEDYGFLTQTCDTACPSSRFVDFSAYQPKFTTTQRHTGKSSLQLNAHENAGILFNLSAGDADAGPLSYITATDGCSGIGTILKKITAPNSVILPVFSPYSGRQMVLSAWVKEQQSCTCTSYTNNDIKVVFTVGSGNQSLTFTPTGNIIEGWQRYESVFTIPAGATTMSVNMEATGTTAVYFDDLRVHPFNANMKSFVYNPVNLRLMAEQDENNYSTFYEYDDDGTLIRVKKETERGIQTIKETRSALLKQ